MLKRQVKTPHTRTKDILLAVVCSLLAGAAQLFLKWGTGHPGTPVLDRLLSLPILLAYILYGLSTLLFIAVLRKGELSVIYPVLGLTYVWVVVASGTVFPSESLNYWKITGSVLIAVGVSAVGGGSRR